VLLLYYINSTLLTPKLEGTKEAGLSEGNLKFQICFLSGGYLTY